MKKLLLGSLTLSAFSLSIIAFQISCRKEASAQTNTNTGLTQLNKMVFIKYNYSLNQLDGIYVCNYDGTGLQKINIANTSRGIGAATLSPDGKTLIYQDGQEPTRIYSCNLDGSNNKLLFGDGVNDFWLQSVH